MVAGLPLVLKEAMNGLRMIFGLTIIPMGRFSFDEATYRRWLWALVPVGLMLSAAGWLVSQLPIDQRYGDTDPLKLCPHRSDPS